MQKRTVKRININLTEREVKALNELKDEWTTRGWKPIEGDIIREAIREYCGKQTGIHM